MNSALPLAILKDSAMKPYRRFPAGFWIVCLCLPSSAFALRQELDRAGLEEALQKASPTKLARLEETQPSQGAPSKKVSLADVETILSVHFPDQIRQAYPPDRYEVTLTPSAGRISSARAMGILTFLSKDKEHQESFLIKKPRSSLEASAAEYASQEGLGPSVLYSSAEILIEELLPEGHDLASRGLLLSLEESALLGRKLADSFHRMVAQGRFLYLTQTPQTHLFLLNSEGEEMAVRFLDWSHARTHPTVEGATHRLEALEQLAFALKTYLRKPRHNVTAWKSLVVRLGELEGASLSYSDPEEGLLVHLRKSLTVENIDPDERASWEEFFRAADKHHVLGTAQIVVTAREMIQRVLGVPWPGLIKESAEMTIQGKRSLRLRILHEDSLLVDSEMAQAITMDLFQRGYLGEKIHMPWGRIVGMLSLYLKSHQVAPQTIEWVEWDLISAMPFEQVLPSRWDIRAPIVETLTQRRLPTPSLLADSFVNFLASQEIQSISIRTATLPGMRNRLENAKGGDLLEVYLEGDPERKIKEYVVKSPHRMDEPARSSLASTLSLGPHVLFTRPYGQEKPAVIVEDWLPSGRNIARVDPEEFADSQARAMLAENLAVMIYTMMDPKRKTVMHALDNQTVHTFILPARPLDDTYDAHQVLMIDWAFPNALGESRYYSGPNKVVEQIAGVLEGFYLDFEKFGPEFWKEFKRDLIGLAHSNGALESEISAGFNRMMDDRIGWLAPRAASAEATAAYVRDLARLLANDLTDAQIAQIVDTLAKIWQDPDRADAPPHREIAQSELIRILTHSGNPAAERAKAYFQEKYPFLAQALPSSTPAGLEEELGRRDPILAQQL